MALEAVQVRSDPLTPGVSGGFSLALAGERTRSLLDERSPLAIPIARSCAHDEAHEPVILRAAAARPARYRAPMGSPRVPGGVVHKLPEDLRRALIANSVALEAWKDITPLARNEFICWVEDAKQEMTRERRIRRTQEELEEGQRRPCCWPGCKHRERTGR